MNFVHSIVRRQEGYGLNCNYDFAICRLRCDPNDVFRGVKRSHLYDQSLQPPVFACKFCSKPDYTEFVALANEDGVIALQNTNFQNIPMDLHACQVHCNAIFDIAWMPEELKIITASADHTARLLDVEGGIREISVYHGHTRSVKTVIFRNDDKAVFATGARDGSIMIWDTRATHNEQPRPDNVIPNAHGYLSVGNSKGRKPVVRTPRSQSVTGLVFQDDFTLISCAAGDSLIKVWDLRKFYSNVRKEPVAKHIIRYTGHSKRNGFSSLMICPSKLVLYASCMDNIIYAYNISLYNSEPVAEYYGHRNCSYFVNTCISPDGRYISSGSSDEYAYIWNTQKPGIPLVKLNGHADEVTCTAWCYNTEPRIVTCSDDSYHKIFRVASEFPEEIEEENKGFAEVIRHCRSVICFSLQSTPTPRIPAQDENSDTPSTESVSTTSSTLKRTYVQMNSISPSSTGSTFRTTLSPIQEHDLHSRPPYAEGFQARGSRRLFSPSSECNNGSFAYDQYNGPSTSYADNSVPFSPTMNLPNFVIDGTAPHLSKISPQKTRDTMDWLTKIRKERYENKIPKPIFEQLSSPKSQTPVRRNTRSKSSEISRPSKSVKSSKPTLLNYFKFNTSKDHENDRCSADSIEVVAPTSDRDSNSTDNVESVPTASDRDGNSTDNTEGVITTSDKESSNSTDNTDVAI